MRMENDSNADFNPNKTLRVTTIVVSFHDHVTLWYGQVLKMRPK